MSIIPYNDDRGQYAWQLWVCLPFKSFARLLSRSLLASIDSDNLYDALGMAIDAEGAICAWKRKGAGTISFGITFCNEKGYVIKPLYRALIQRLGYNLSLSKAPKGRRDEVRRP